MELTNNYILCADEPSMTSQQRSFYAYSMENAVQQNAL